MPYRNHTSYANLGTSCCPQTISCTSNHKFLTLLEPKYRDITIYKNKYNYIPESTTYEDLNRTVNINGEYNPLSRVYAGKNNEYRPRTIDVVYTLPDEYNPLTGNTKIVKNVKSKLINAGLKKCKNC